MPATPSIRRLNSRTLIVLIPQAHQFHLFNLAGNCTRTVMRHSQFILRDDENKTSGDCIRKCNRRRQKLQIRGCGSGSRLPLIHSLIRPDQSEHPEQNARHDERAGNGSLKHERSAGEYDLSLRIINTSTTARIDEQDVI